MSRLVTVAMRRRANGAGAGILAGPVWLGFPPSTISVRSSSVYGPIDVNGHYVICRAVTDRDTFYPKTCPAGSDYTGFDPP